MLQIFIKIIQYQKKDIYLKEINLMLNNTIKIVKFNKFMLAQSLTHNQVLPNI